MLIFIFAHTQGFLLLKTKTLGVFRVPVASRERGGPPVPHLRFTPRFVDDTRSGFRPSASAAPPFLIPWVGTARVPEPFVSPGQVSVCLYSMSSSRSGVPVADSPLYEGRPSTVRHGAESDRGDSVGRTTEDFGDPSGSQCLVSSPDPRLVPHLVCVEGTEIPFCVPVVVCLASAGNRMRPTVRPERVSRSSSGSSSGSRLQLETKIDGKGTSLRGRKSSRGTRRVPST